MNLVVGLTGGIGTGKTRVSDLFASHGLPIIDTDVIAHQLTAPGGTALPALTQVFGNAILDAEGALDRRQMRDRIFSSPQDKARLEQILHPMIFDRVQTSLRSISQPGPVILVVPLLVESPRYQSLVDRIAVVDCPEDVQIRRAMTRSSLDETTVRGIMATQATRNQRLRLADDIIDNSGTLPELANQIRLLAGQYRKLSLAAQSVTSEKPES